MATYIFSKKIRKINNLSIFLGDMVVSNINQADTIAGWGKRPTTKHARLYAEKHHIPYIALEDGFIHSLGQGILGYSSCSMVTDKTGIYYDATSPSDLELLISSHKTLNDSEYKNLRLLISRIITSNISKYNNAPIHYDLGQKDQKWVLLVDQTIGDMSLEYGYANLNTFSQMLKSAIQEHPTARFFIKTHPDVLAGKKKGCFDLNKLSDEFTIISASLNSISLIKSMDHVYIATSQMGFEALLVGKPVTCFGVPFYAGWGLTDDRADKTLPVFKRRNKTRSVEDIFHAAYILYTRYVHPDNNKLCGLEEIIKFFELQYSKYSENQGSIFCFGLSHSFWKKKYIRYFLKSPHNKILFPSSTRHALQMGFNSQSKAIIWGHRNYDSIKLLTDQFDIIPQHIEDGFIRSIGLGSDLNAPLSLVIDTHGIYYDPSQPNDLENLLLNNHIQNHQIERAKNLRESILRKSISKYNVGKTISAYSIQAFPKQKVILVPGQVENDISILKGCIDVNTNLKLLQNVRKNNPDAYIIYKPHPDVISKNRIGNISKEIAYQYCDLILEDVSITDCLKIAHELHTMTSLVGFEALLRAIPVTCYGIPFYAGWGLTKDIYHISRRNKKIALDELVYAVLIAYPRYINWQTKAFTTPETIIDLLSEQIEQQGGKISVKMPWFQRKLHKIINILRGIFIY